MTLVATVALMTVPVPASDQFDAAKAQAIELLAKHNIGPYSVVGCRETVHDLFAGRQADAFCLDDYSGYVPAGPQAKAIEAYYRNTDSVKMRTIGVAVVKWGTEIVVAGVGDGPAKGKLFIGDVIYDIKTKETIGENCGSPKRTEYTTAKCLMGPEGSRVRVVVKRGGKKVKVDLLRTADHVPTVFYKDFGDFGYVRLTRFDEDTGLDSVETMLQSPYQGIIIDVRNNGGGFAKSKRLIALAFAPHAETILYTTRTREEEIFHTAKAEREDLGGDVEIGALADRTVVILTNSYSKSAAELVAGSLMATRLSTNDRLVIGEETYGKWRAQQFFKLVNGGYFAISVQEECSGRNQICGQEDGLKPDIQVKDTREEFADTATAKDQIFVEAVKHLRSLSTTTTVAALAQ